MARKTKAAEILARKFRETEGENIPQNQRTAIAFSKARRAGARLPPPPPKKPGGTSHREPTPLAPLPEEPGTEMSEEEKATIENAKVRKRAQLARAQQRPKMPKSKGNQFFDELEEAFGMRESMEIE